MITLTLVDLEY